MTGMEPSHPEIEGAVLAPTPIRRSQEHWILLLSAVGALLLLAVLALWIHPDPRGFGTHEQLGLPACRMMDWTGIPCPGCGVTTSVALFVHGQFLASFHNQPFGFLVALAIPLYAAWAIASHLLGRDLARDMQLLRIRTFVAGGFAAIALGWLYKIAIVKGWTA
jgi:hypothetical protein